MSQIDTYPGDVRPMQVDDTVTAASGMGRPALHAVLHTAGGPTHVLTCHLKSKLLTFPGGRFSPRDENDRARFAAFTLFGRAAEATTVRTDAVAFLAKDPAARLVVQGDRKDEVQPQTT